MAFDFGDIASRYAQTRWDQATSPFTDPEAYLNKRLEDQYGVDMNGNVKPKSTTISYNDDGTQTVTQKQEIIPPTVQAEPIAAPVNPQQFGTAPAMPQPGPGVQVASVGPSIPQTQPAPAVQPPTVDQLAAQQREKALAAQQAQAPAQPVVPQQPAPQVELPQPGPGVQVAGPAVPGAMPAPVAQQPVAAPVAQPAPAAAPAPQTSFDTVAQLYSIVNDPTKLAAFYGNEKNTPEARQLAARLYKDHIQTEDKQQQAEQLLKTSVETGNWLPLMKEIKSKSEDGSYVKAILYARLGLNDLAKEEQQKLGAGTKYEVATGPKGEQALIQYDGQGLPLKGFNADGTSLTPRELSSFASGALPTKSHLLPSVHGTPVQNAQGETGLMMYDPRSRSSYVQVGSERKSTAGWTTMSQNPNAVYGAAGAKAQGTAAGEGYTPTVLPERPVAGGAVAPTGNAAQVAQQLGVPVISGQRSTEKQWELYDAWVAGGRKGNPVARPGTSKHETGNAIDVDSSKLTTQQRQALTNNGFVQTLPQKDPNHWEYRPQGAAPTGATPLWKQKQSTELGTAAGKEEIQVGGKRSESFNKILDEEVRPQAQQGDTIVNTRKQQFQIFNRPGVDMDKIFGLYNAAGEGTGDQKLSIVRDILGGMFKPEAEVSQRLAQLNLSPQEKAALAEYNIANAKINAATLKQTAGAGSVSDAEQRSNREMNVDPTKIPALGAYNGMAQSQFSGDLARYKGDWADKQPATNALQLDKAWRKEQDSLIKMYAEVAKQRAEWISKNGATTSAVKQGYIRFPVPEYDPNTETWKKTKPLNQIFERK